MSAPPSLKPDDSEERTGREGDVQGPTRQWLLLELRRVMEIALDRVTGSKTPPEIAVAILAEMTAVRHGVSEPSWAAKPARRFDPSACEVAPAVSSHKV